MQSKAIYVDAGGGYERIIVGGCETHMPEPGELTVRLRASSLNYHDYLIVTGGKPLKERRIPMADGAGEVVAVGDGVTEFAVGDAVVSTFFPSWLEGQPVEAGFRTVPGDGVDGYAREHVTAPARAFTHAPRGWSHAEAATLTTAGLTAWRVLACEARLKAGDSVLVQGTGGVSIFALQLARMMGASVIATSSSDAKLERLKALGADHVINYCVHEDWAQVALDLTAGRGVDVVVDVGGPATLGQSVAAARVGGHVGMVGTLTVGSGSEFPLRQALYRQLRLQGVLVGNRSQQQELIRAIDANGMRPVLDRSFALDALADAFRHQESGRHFGKIVLEI